MSIGRWISVWGVCAVFGLAGLALSGCERDAGDHMEDAGESLQDAAESTRDAGQRAAEDAADAIDDAIDN